MKRKWIICGLIVIILALVLAINIPIRTEVSTISVAELDDYDTYYGEMAKEIRKTISENSGVQVTFGQVYGLRSHYLFGNDKVVLSVPYSAVITMPVGKAGITYWTLWFNSLTTVWSGDKHKNLNIPYAESLKCHVEADPNTCLNMQAVKCNYVETELNDKNLDAVVGYWQSIRAVTKDSSVQLNTECTVSIRWEGKKVLPLGVFWHKSIPFEVTSSAKYINNFHLT